MTDEAALHRAILADPADDLVRLLYAEELDENSGMVECGRCNGNGWLNEFGYPAGGRFGDCPTCSGAGRISDGRAERAEFIRVQVELARIHDDADPKRGVYFIDGQGHYAATPERKRWEDLRRRERKLWIDGLLAHCKPTDWPELVLHRFEDQPNFTPRNPEGYVHRGFVSRLHCSWSAWLAHHAAIYWEPGQGRDCPRGAQPIEEVRLSTMPRSEMLGSRSKPRGRFARLEGCQIHFLEGEWRNGDDLPRTSVVTLLPREWPRLKFVLPAERDQRILPDQPIHWDDAGPPIPARADTEETR